MKKHKLVCLLMLFVLFNASLISAAEEVKEKIIFVGYTEDPGLEAYLEKEDNEKKLYQWRSLNQAIFEKSERDGSCILTIEFNGLITTFGRTNRMNTGKKSCRLKSKVRLTSSFVKKLVILLKKQSMTNSLTTSPTS